MTYSLQMLVINATLNDEATSMLIGYLNSGVLDTTAREQVINACQRSCTLRQTETGLFYKV